MKILFLVYHGFSEHSGISKKIHYQVKGLKENGYDVRLCYYDFSPEGHRCRYIDGEVLKDYGKGRLAGLRQRFDYDCIYDYCIREGIEFIYARSFINANPWLIRFFKKLHKEGIHAVTEIPTYPYDHEYNRNSYWDMRLALNDSIPLHQPSAISHQPSELHLIGVAEVHPWHAFDRVMIGIGEYYSHQPSAISHQKDVYFHVVGGVHPNHMKNCFEPIIEKYPNIKDKIIFHGTQFGKELDDIFNQCQFAIGSLGRHRSGITVIKTLKNREYATRGIPFIYSEQDSDFDDQPYIIKAPADESPIDIQQIIDFMQDFKMAPEDIRKTVESLQWKYQMQKVVDAVFNPQ